MTQHLQKVPRLVLMDLIATTTAIAVAMSIAVPLSKLVTPITTSQIIPLAGLHLLVFLGGMLAEFKSRESILRAAGPVVGFGLARKAKAALIWTWFLFALAASVSAISLLMFHQLGICTAIHSFSAGSLYTRCLLRLHPAAIHFFQNGVAAGRIFYPWSKVKLLASDAKGMDESSLSFRCPDSSAVQIDIPNSLWDRLKPLVEHRAPSQP